MYRNALKSAVLAVFAAVRALPGSVLAETRILSRATPGLPNTMRRSSGPPWQPVRTPPEISVAARRDRGNLKALLRVEAVGTAAGPPPPGGGILPCGRPGARYADSPSSASDPKGS